MKFKVIFEDGQPSLIVGLTGHSDLKPIFVMEGSTAVFVGPRSDERREKVASAVADELPFVQAVSMEVEQ